MGTSEENAPLKISQATLADLYEQLGSCVTGLRDACDRLNEVSTRMIQMGERLAKVEVRLNGHTPPPPDLPRSPSNLYEAVGKKLEQQGEEVTERIKLEAIVAAQKAVAETLAEKAKEEADRLEQASKVEATRLRIANDAALNEMELKHRRSMLRVTFAGAILTMLAGTGIFTAVQTLLSTRAAQTETQKTLKRIEAKQARTASRPDAAVGP